MTDHMNSGVAVLTPEKWTNRINKEYYEKLKAGKWFLDLSEDVSDGGDKIHIPNLGSMTVNTKEFEQNVKLNKADSADVSLEVDTWREVSFLIEDNKLAQTQRSYHAQEAYAKKAGALIREDLEAAILEEAKNFTSSVGSATTNLTESHILQAITILSEKDINVEDEAAFFMHPATFYRQVDTASKYQAVTSTGEGKLAQATKITRTIYGIETFVSSLVPFNTVTSTTSTGRVNCLATKDAITFATTSLPKPAGIECAIGEKNVRMTTSYIAEKKGLLTTVDILYGVKASNPGHGVKLLSHENYKA